MHYALNELIYEAEERAPSGRTLAVKRSAWVLPGEDGAAFMRLRLVSAEPDEYIISGGKQLKGGLAARTLKMAIESQEETTTSGYVVTNEGEIITRPVSAVQFSGRLLIPEVAEIPVLGATVPFELATGFVRMIEAADAGHIFSGAQAS